MIKRGTAVRVAGWSLVGIGLCALFFAGSGGSGVTADPGVADTRGEGTVRVLSVPEIAESSPVLSPEAESQDQVAASPLDGALSVHLDGATTGGGITRTALTIPGEVPPVLLAANSSSGTGDAAEPLTADMPFSAFSEHDPGLSSANSLSPFSPGGGGGGGGAGGLPTNQLQAIVPEVVLPGADPGGAVPEPTARDLFQLAGALLMWLAFRRLSV